MALVFYSDATRELPSSLFHVRIQEDHHLYTWKQVLTRGQVRCHLDPGPPSLQKGEEVMFVVSAIQSTALCFRGLNWLRPAHEIVPAC